MPLSKYLQSKSIDINKAQIYLENVSEKISLRNKNCHVFDIFRSTGKKEKKVHKRFSKKHNLNIVLPSHKMLEELGTDNFNDDSWTKFSNFL